MMGTMRAVRRGRSRRRSHAGVGGLVVVSWVAGLRRLAGVASGCLRVGGLVGHSAVVYRSGDGGFGCWGNSSLRSTICRGRTQTLYVVRSGSGSSGGGSQVIRVHRIAPRKAMPLRAGDAARAEEHSRGPAGQGSGDTRTPRHKHRCHETGAVQRKREHCQAYEEPDRPARHGSAEIGGGACPCRLLPKQCERCLLPSISTRRSVIQESPKRFVCDVRTVHVHAKRGGFLQPFREALDISLHRYYRKFGQVTSQNIVEHVVG
ncbi:hypothetical protein OH77DRAFT_310173 [Trametes cingulata]|nr:hypothetical protein OH77DRAFT_310173 [Trametes cingulata]